MKKDLFTKNLISIYLGFLSLILLTFFINIWFYCQSNIRTISSQVKSNSYDLYKISQILENNSANKLLTGTSITKNGEHFFSAGDENPFHFFLNQYTMEFKSVNDTIKVKFTFKIDLYFLLPYAVVAVLYTLFFFIIANVLLKNKSLEKKYNELASTSFQLSQKLAHDIRSPLSTLNLISSKISDDDLREIQLAVVDKINLIANEHLEKSKIYDLEIRVTKSFNTSTENYGVDVMAQPYSLQSYFERFEQEYQIRKSLISQKLEININYLLIKNKFVSKELENLIYRSMNNFIQNSIDATASNGVIKIYVSSPTNKKNHSLSIIIEDNGKGIPQLILERLGKERISFGKDLTGTDGCIKSGNGIALLNAKQDLQLCGADLEIFSIEGAGTKVVINL